MSSVTLNFVANVPKEQMESTQKIKMVMFHSPSGLRVEPDLQKDAELFIMVFIK